jgi:Flp pilus assembly protein TadG
MTRPLKRRRRSGQSIVEFALVVPVMMLLLVAIADFGRLYTSAVAVEAAGREAADFGAFKASDWGSGNAPTMTALMEERACTAAAGSHLEGYESTDPANKTCTNPAFNCTLELGGGSSDCATSGGLVGTTDCSTIPSTDPPCTVHVRMVYEFRTILAIPPLPASIQVVRESRFRLSNLEPPPP